MTETTERTGLILALLRDAGPLTTIEIAEGVGAPYAGHVDTVLRRLYREGGIDRTPPHAASRILWWIKGQS